MKKTLLQPNDIVHYTDVSKDFPLCKFRELYETEYYEFTNILGIAFYAELKLDLVDYSAALPYENSTTYAIDATCVYEGIVYKAIAESTGNLPQNIDFWALAQRFATPCFETLWCDHLASYLGWIVVRKKLAFMTSQITAKGVVKTHGDNFQTVSSKDYHNLQAACDRQIEIGFNNLHHFMTNNNGEGCYDNYKGIAVSCCGDCGQSNDDCACKLDNEKNNTGYTYLVG